MIIRRWKARLRVIPIKTPSEEDFYIYGSGRVDVDKVHDRVVNKWHWGGFDKHRTLNNSFGASVQAQKMIIWRSAEEMLAEGKDQKQLYHGCLFQGISI
jgi:hypothetical protein